jgi:hypothetical protein
MAEEVRIWKAGDELTDINRAKLSLKVRREVLTRRSKLEPNEVLLTIRQRGTNVVVTMKTVNEEGDVVLRSDVTAEQVIEVFIAKFPHARVVVHNLRIQ